MNFYPVSRFLVTPLLITRYCVTLFSNTPVGCLFLSLVKSWVYFFRWLRREVADSIEDKGQNNLIISAGAF